MKNKILNKKVGLGVSSVFVVASAIALPFTSNLFKTMEVFEVKLNIALLVTFLALTSMFGFFVYKERKVANKSVTDAVEVPVNDENKNASEQLTNEAFKEEYDVIEAKQVTQEELDEARETHSTPNKDGKEGFVDLSAFTALKGSNNAKKEKFEQLFQKVTTQYQLDMCKEQPSIYNDMYAADKEFKSKVDSIEENTFLLNKLDEIEKRRDQLLNELERLSDYANFCTDVCLDKGLNM